MKNKNIRYLISAIGIFILTGVMTVICYMINLYLVFNNGDSFLNTIFIILTFVGVISLVFDFMAILFFATRVLIDKKESRKGKE